VTGAFGSRRADGRNRKASLLHFVIHTAAEEGVCAAPIRRARRRSESRICSGDFTVRIACYFHAQFGTGLTPWHARGRSGTVISANQRVPTMPNLTTLHDRMTRPGGADRRAADRDSRELDFGYSVAGFAFHDAGGDGAETARGIASLWTAGPGSRLKSAPFVERPFPSYPQAFARPTPPSCVMGSKRVQEASSALVT
jgi:hypothetical protein